VFPEEPITEHPLFGMPGVVVTPHLGASTVEAQDRAGQIVAEEVVAALTGGLVTNAVNIPAVGQEDIEVLGPFVPLVAKLGRLAVEGDSVEHDGHRIVVQDVENRRVGRVRVTVVPAEAVAEPEPPAAGPAVEPAVEPASDDKAS
jgi:hypothetical protein